MAIDNSNQLTEEKLEVAYELPTSIIADLDNPSDVDVNIPQGKMQKPNAVALVIGIEQYRYIPDAQYADRDAIAFRQYLIDLLGFSPENILLLINEEATLGDIRKGLRQLKQRIQSDQSDVIVYYSGHGAPTLDGKRKFLVPYDGDPNYLRGGHN